MEETERLIHLLKVTIPLWHMILSQSLVKQPFILWVRNLGRALAKQFLLECLSYSCHQISAGAPAKWDTQDHSLTCLVVDVGCKL